jgi:hypothetical protein
MCPHCGLFYFGPFNTFHCSPLASTLFQQLSIYILIFSTSTGIMFYDIVDALLFSFPFPPSSSSIQYFHYYKHGLQMILYMIMFGFMYIFFFFIYLPCIRKIMCKLCLSEPGLFHLT